ncbi:carbohydrate ABC transporter membrane protein 1 (CUT1 family) [Kribbella amoyensis]|uniref:Carbohydrate ABC transporter membrane protein 1 (CUT1 family) n=1 Tax=Kribbella amoyensis TaxID=996641 RepID=A0A561BUU5_9ACTN|nr:carbohydrate ABC transporter membrane protein 1 (CUT1 family) [Kribbella amoyensis]
MAVAFPAMRGGRRTRYQNGWALLFLAPWLIGFLAFTAGPMLMSLYLAFTKYDLLTAPKWIGWGNFGRMFGDDPLFLQSLKVTAIYVVVGTPLSLAFALAVAVVLNRGLRGLDFYRSAIYLPSLFGGSVAIAVLWRKVFNGDGLVNQILALVGITGPSWISEPHTALGTLIALEVWQFGAPMVIFLAGLRQIPREFYEAAQVDGASRYRQFWSITMPLLSPIVFFNLTLQLIRSFQAFAPAFIISDGSGGPADSTLFYSLYLYQEGFVNFDMGYAAAMAWMLVLLAGAVVAVNFLFGRYWVHYGD